MADYESNLIVCTCHCDGLKVYGYAPSGEASEDVVIVSLWQMAGEGRFELFRRIRAAWCMLLHGRVEHSGEVVLNRLGSYALIEALSEARKVAFPKPQGQLAQLLDPANFVRVSGPFRPRMAEFVRRGLFVEKHRWEKACDPNLAFIKDYHTRVAFEGADGFSWSCECPDGQVMRSTNIPCKHALRLAASPQD